MKLFWKILGIIILLLIIACGFFYFRFKPAQSQTWGLTFSYQEAEGLGFDWKTMFLDMLSDLKPKNLRLMTYWEDAEPQPGQFNFNIPDQMLEESAKQNVQVLLVVGLKQPRWPECHVPSWYNSLSKGDQDAAVLDFVQTEIEHFKSFPAVTAWQVENEPYFGFGPDCPTESSDLLDKEVALVKSLDSRPVVVTDSGDRGGWIPAANSGADILGFTLYRVSYDQKYGGYYKYPLPAAFYRVRAGILQTFTHTKQVEDVELQMEPWFTDGALNTPLDVQDALMNPKVFDQNIKYAESTGVGTHYLWGVEWWYWMAKKNNDWGMWNEAKKLFSGQL
ncbi:MAG TPA: hypothetical protein VFX17_04015 [Patescibacteria group bacterium]|nr:hypothetical protein [Patescibacteria group bacterium]